MPWRRGRSDAEPDPVAVLTERLAHLEQRLDDVEDTATQALAPDRVDLLAGRLEELSLSMATQEDLLESRLHTARVSTEVARIAAELRAEIDHVRTSAPPAATAAPRADLAPAAATPRPEPMADDDEDDGGDGGRGAIPSVIDLRPPAASAAAAWDDDDDEDDDLLDMDDTGDSWFGSV